MTDRQVAGMFRVPCFGRRRAAVALALTALVPCLVAGCNDAEGARIDATRSLLVGTWLREAEEGPTRLKRVLVLGAEGKFTERIVLTRPSEAPRQKEFAGEWSYDGVNLKRRFLQEDGRQYSGGTVRYATFPLVSAAKSEFVVEDTIVNAKAVYRRVREGVQP